MSLSEAATAVIVLDELGEKNKNCVFVIGRKKEETFEFILVIVSRVICK